MNVMNVLNHVKIGVKLFGAFMLVIILLAVVAFVGINSADTLHTLLSDMYRNRLEPLRQAAEANQYFIYFGRDLRDHLLTDDLARKNQIQERLREHEKTLFALLEEYRKSEMIEQEREDLAKFDAVWPTYRVTVDRVIALSAAFKLDEAKAELNGKVNELRQVIDDTLESLVRVNQDLAKQADAESGEIAAASRKTILGTALGAGVAALVIALILTFSLTGPLSRAVQMLRELGQGHFGSRLRMDRRDELGLMARTLDEFADDL